MTRRYPRRGTSLLLSSVVFDVDLLYPLERMFFFMSILRNGVVLVVITIAAWLYCRHRVVKGKYPIKILETVPRGFQVCKISLFVCYCS